MFSAIELSKAVYFLPVLISVVAVVGLWIDRESLAELARRTTAKKAFTPEKSLRSRLSIPTVPATKPGNESPKEFSPDTLREALDGMTNYVAQLKPDWIVGLHPGGRFLSVYVASQLDIHPRQCLYLRDAPSGSFEFERQTSWGRSNQPPFEGKMLILDDISRSGRTLSAVKRFMMMKNYTEGFNLHMIQVAVLLVIAKAESDAFKFRPDWAAFRTDQDFFRLPWSRLTMQMDFAFETRNRDMFVGPEIEEYFRIVRDFDYALKESRRIIERAYRGVMLA